MVDLLCLAAFVVGGLDAASDDAVEDLAQLLHALSEILLAMDARAVESTATRLPVAGRAKVIELVSVLFTCVLEEFENVLPVEVNLLFDTILVFQNGLVIALAVQNLGLE